MSTAPDGTTADGDAAEGTVADRDAAEGTAADGGAAEGNSVPGVVAERDSATFSALAARVSEEAVAEGNSADRAGRRGSALVVRRPLSPGQRRAWFLQHRDPSNADLNVGISYRLTGDLDAALLRAAVGEVVARHDILRTVYGAGADGELFQSVLADSECAWQEADLADLPSTSRSRRAEVLIRRILGEPFAPVAAPPIRFALIRTGADEYVFALVAHALCWDDESWDIFARDLAAAYNGRLPAAPAIQYADLAVGASNSIAPPSDAVHARAAASHGTTASAAIVDAADSTTTGVMSLPYSDDRGVCAVGMDDAGVEFWRSELSPLPEPLELPGHAAMSPRSVSARRVVRELPAELVSAVEDFAVRFHAAGPDTAAAPRHRPAAAPRRPGASPFGSGDGEGRPLESVLLAAFEVLMCRYTGTADFLVSAPVSTREGRRCRIARMRRSATSAIPCCCVLPSMIGGPSLNSLPLCGIPGFGRMSIGRSASTGWWRLSIRSGPGIGMGWTNWFGSVSGCVPLRSVRCSTG